MPGLCLLDDGYVDGIANEASREQVSKEDFNQRIFPRSHFSGQSPQSDSFDLGIDAVVDTSIEQLYDNVCEMQSSDESPSRHSFGSYGAESRIDSELCHLAGDVEITKEVIVEKEEQKTLSQLVPENGEVATTKGSNKKIASPISVASAQSNRALRSSPRSKFSQAGGGQENTLRKSGLPNPVKKQRNSVSGRPKLLESRADSIDSGASLLKQARDLISSGDNPHRALELALRAKKSFEKGQDGKNNLDMVMCLHVLAAIYCSLDQHDNAIPILERSIEIPTMEEGENHALAKFAGCMQLGDIYAMLGQIENSILFYSAGLEIQRQVLGENDPRVGEICRYVAEAHVQALQFDEAEKLCLMALDIHKENGSPASLEEAADRRLMGLICESKGEHEAALENYVLASSAMASNGHQIDQASVDCSIGDTYLSLARYDEAIFAYQKALTAFKSARGENHPTVASIYVRLADLNNKIGKFKESKSYCESALRIYGKPIPGIPLEEFASGLVDVSAIYESVNDLEMAFKLLQKALKTYTRISGQQNTVAGIEAQVGVMHYMMGNYAASYKSFKNSILKFRASGEKKSALFGVALNQMGLVCVHRYAIDEAAELFEEARDVLEKESGPYHPDTLGVYSNLAGTYDAMGRLDDAIEILEYVVEMREEKLGTANPDVDDEKRRLAELLREAGRARTRKSRPLENFLTSKPHSSIQEGIKTF